MEVGRREAFVIIFIGLLLTGLVISFVSTSDTPDKIEDQDPVDIVVNDEYSSDITVVYDKKGEMICYVLVRNDNSLQPIDCVPIEQTNYTSSDFNR